MKIPFISKILEKNKLEKEVRQMRIANDAQKSIIQSLVVGGIGRNAIGEVTNRAFDGFSPDEDHPELAVSWIDVNTLLSAKLWQMKTVCRSFYSDNSLMARYVNTTTKNAIGSKNWKLQIDDNELFQSQIDFIHEKWCKFTRSPDFSVSGQSENKFVKQLCKNFVLEGEAFVELVDINGKLTCKLIDSFSCDFTMTKQLENGNQIVNGVEIDKYGRAVAYYFSNRAGISSQVAQLVPQMFYSGMTSERVPANRIVHLFNPVYAGQTRGFPTASAVTILLSDLNAYREDTLEASRMFARKLIYYKCSQGLPEQTKEKANPRIAEILPPGVEPYQLDPKQPVQTYPEFYESLAQSIASGLDLSYAELTGDLSKSSYSSARIGRLGDIETYRDIQGTIIDRFYSKVFSEFVEKLNLDEDNNDILPRASDLSFRFIPNALPLLEMEKELAGYREAINMGVMDLLTVCNELGTDFETVCRNQEKARKIAEDNGINWEMLQAKTAPINTQAELAKNAVTEEETPKNANE